MNRSPIQRNLSLIVALITILGAIGSVIFFVAEMNHSVERIHIRVERLAQEAMENIENDSQLKARVDNLEECCDHIKK